MGEIKVLATAQEVVANAVTERFMYDACGDERLTEDTFYLLEQRLTPYTAVRTEDRLVQVAEATPSAAEREVIGSLAVCALVRSESTIQEKREFARTIAATLLAVTPITATRLRSELVPGQKAVRQKGHLSLLQLAQ